MEIKKDVEQKVKGLSVRFIIVAGIFLSAIALFSAIADEMVLENENHLDKVVFQQIQTITNPAMTHLMLMITFFGSHYFMLPAYIILIVYFLFFRKDRKMSLDIASVGIIGTIILFTLKDIFHRHRPLDPLIKNINGFSFPSGHSFSAFTLFGLLIYIIWKQPVKLMWKWIWSILFFLLACSVAVSRVYLHVHYASDVVAGFCLCVVWLTISFWVLSKLNRLNKI